MAAEVWSLIGDSRGTAETSLGMVGYGVSSHNLTLPSSTWKGKQIREIIRICKAAGCQVKFTKSSNGTPETFALSGDGRSEVETSLTAAGYAVSSHNVTLPSSSWTMAQLDEILRICETGQVTLTYTKSS
jgi:hypothetical protein